MNFGENQIEGDTSNSHLVSSSLPMTANIYGWPSPNSSSPTWSLAYPNFVPPHDFVGASAIGAENVLHMHRPTQQFLQHQYYQNVDTGHRLQQHKTCPTKPIRPQARISPNATALQHTQPFQFQICQQQCHQQQLLISHRIRIELNIKAQQLLALENLQLEPIRGAIVTSPTQSNSHKNDI